MFQGTKGPLFLGTLEFHARRKSEGRRARHETLMFRNKGAFVLGTLEFHERRKSEGRRAKHETPMCHGTKAPLCHGTLGFHARRKSEGWRVRNETGAERGARGQNSTFGFEVGIELTLATNFGGARKR